MVGNTDSLTPIVRILTNSSTIENSLNLRKHTISMKKTLPVTSIKEGVSVLTIAYCDKKHFELNRRG